MDHHGETWGKGGEMFISNQGTIDTTAVSVMDFREDPCIILIFFKKEDI